MPKTAWKTLLFATETHRWLIIVMWLFIIAANLFAYLLPLFFKQIADYAVATPPEAFVIGELLYPVIGVVTFLLGLEICARIGHIIEIPAVLRSFERVTTHLYSNLLNRPASYFEDRFSGELSRRIEQIGESVKFFIEDFPWEICWAVIAFIAATILLYIAHPVLFLYFAIWLVVFLLTSYPLLRRQYQQTQKVATSYAKLSGTMVDTLTNINLVHSFGAIKKEERNLKGGLGSVLGSEHKERWIYVLNKFHQGISIIILGIMLTLVSIQLFADQVLTVGDFVIVAVTLPSLTSVIWNAGDSLITAIRHYGNLTDAVADLQTETETLEEGSTNLKSKKGTIHFNNLSFTYPGSNEKIFDTFSLHLKSGERVGVVGPSGAGKSTLIKLLLRQYDPQLGAITIDDADIKDVTLHSLRESIAFVPQDTTLFHRTLFENIQYAKENATKDEVMTASKKAQAHEFIQTMPNLYETRVGERGIKLSGGQRQRIAVARAMLKNAPILVLDEATSALDSESEEIVQQGLHNLFQGRTVIAIAHRLSTLREMDRIVVMQNGKIVEDGAPVDLLAKEASIFKDMWEHQKGGFVA